MLQLLKRRAKAAPPSIIGIDDPSIIDGAPDATTTEIPVVNSPVRPSTFADTVVRHTLKLLYLVLIVAFPYIARHQSPRVLRDSNDALERLPVVLPTRRPPKAKPFSSQARNLR
jgi:hypothetical protein